MGISTFVCKETARRLGSGELCLQHGRDAGCAAGDCQSQSRRATLPDASHASALRSAKLAPAESKCGIVETS